MKIWVFSTVFGQLSSCSVKKSTFSSESLIHTVLSCLKVGTWSTWLTNILQNNSNDGTGATVIDDEDTQFITFPLLKAVADLLMLPRDMIADKSVRKEVGYIIYNNDYQIPMQGILMFTLLQICVQVLVKVTCRQHFWVLPLENICS